MSSGSPPGGQGHEWQVEPLKPARDSLPGLPLSRKQAKPRSLPWPTGLVRTAKQGSSPTRGPESCEAGSLS